MAERTDIHLVLKCAKCGRALEVDGDSKETRMQFHSAYNAEATMLIRPCAHCIAEKTESATNLAKAIKKLTQ